MAHPHLSCADPDVDRDGGQLRTRPVDPEAALNVPTVDEDLFAERMRSVHRQAVIAGLGLIGGRPASPATLQGHEWHDHASRSGV
jgi:hypothetical protein